MSSAHVYIIPAKDQETRNPNKMAEILPAQGKLVINSRQIHRAKNSGSVLLVPYIAQEGRPMFDRENPAHQLAAAAYELSQIETTIARAKLDIQQKEQALGTAGEELHAAEEAVEAAEQALNAAREALAELEDLHGSDDDNGADDDDSGSDDDETDIEELAKIAIGELEEGNEDHWTNDNKPDVNAINAILNDGADESAEKLKITAAQRDSIWAEIQEQAAAE